MCGVGVGRLEVREPRQGGGYERLAGNVGEEVGGGGGGHINLVIDFKQKTGVPCMLM
jgi:hypothetical protein